MSKKKKEKKKVKKSELILGITVVGLLLAILVTGLLFLLLREERIDRAARILGENDYNVLVVREGDENGFDLEERLNARLRGIDKNSLDVIEILEFKEEEDARNFYEREKKNYTLMETIKRYGRYVYFGSIGSFELLE